MFIEAPESLVLESLPESITPAQADLDWKAHLERKLVVALPGLNGATTPDSIHDPEVIIFCLSWFCGVLSCFGALAN